MVEYLGLPNPNQDPFWVTGVPYLTLAKHATQLSIVNQVEYLGECGIKTWDAGRHSNRNVRVAPPAPPLIAQSVEHRTGNPEVVGSIPT